MQSQSLVMRPNSTDDNIRKLDAREIDGEPFGKIITELEALPEEETLVLINSFEPAPLYNVLKQRGFTYETSQVSDNEYHVSITHA